MKLYLMRHAQAEDGDELDPTRKLTGTGKDQAKMMGKWLRRQTEKPELLIQSNMKRSQQTAKRVGKKLDLEPITSGAIDPDGTPENAWAEIQRLGKEAGAKSVLAVSHGPLLPDMLAYLTGSDAPEQFHFAHGAVAHVQPPDDDDVERSKVRAGKGTGKQIKAAAGVKPGSGILHWMVTPNVVARDQDEMDLVTSKTKDVAEAALRYLDAVLEVEPQSVLTS